MITGKDEQEDEDELRLSSRFLFVGNKKLIIRINGLPEGPEGEGGGEEEEWGGRGGGDAIWFPNEAPIFGEKSHSCAEEEEVTTTQTHDFSDPLILSVK